MKKMNDFVFDAIKKSLTDDIKIAYEVFKEENIDKELSGVTIHLNSTKGFGEYLKNNPQYIRDLLEPLYQELDFCIKLVFSKDGDEEFYPLFE